MTRAYFQNPLVAAEQRPIVAHGETVGYQPQTVQAPEWGDRNVLTPVFFRPDRGLIFLTANPTVSPWATGLRASGAGTTKRF